MLALQTSQLTPKTLAFLVRSYRILDDLLAEDLLADDLLAEDLFAANWLARTGIDHMNRQATSA